MAENVPELVATMLRNPLAQRFMARIQATGDNRIYTADDVLGERIVRMAGMIAGEHERPGVILSPRRPNLSLLESHIVTARLALSATPYLWTEDVRAGLRSLEIPRHTLSPRLLPQPRSWHTFETGIETDFSADFAGHHYDVAGFDALLVCDTGKGLEVLVFGELTDAETGEPRPIIAGGPARYGVIYPDEMAVEWRGALDAVLRMFAFLNSPYIPKRQVRASRSARREAQRTGSPVSDELVTFVMLRRPATRHTANEDSQSVEWRHRWLVNGHLRAQWYPSEQAHRLIWIAPYLKGPEDAPMLEHAYKVVQ